MNENKQFQSQVRLKDFNPVQGLNRESSKIKEIAWYLIKTLFFLTAIPYPTNLKVFFLRIFGARVGYGVIIKPRVNIHFPWKLDIGNHVWIGEEVFILNFEKVKIGNNVCISQRSFLCGGNHDYRIPSMPYRNGPISLEDGCWVGACCFIGPGVTIGIDTVVTVGSVVTNSLEANLVCKVSSPDFIKSRWKII